MKQLKFIIIMILGLLLTGCESNIVDIPTIQDETPLVIPTEKAEALPDAASRFILYYNFHKSKFEQGTLYQPGTYVKFVEEPNSTDGYQFAVVVINLYGEIASVYLDETYSNQYLYKDASNNIYTYVEGSETYPIDSYRLIDLNTPYSAYPTAEIPAGELDLVVGKDEEAIRKLTTLQVNETKRYLNGELSIYGGLSYTEQMRLIEEKIIAEQSIYGFDLYKAGKRAKTDTLPGVTIDLKYHLQLVKDILDIDAKLQEDTTLLDHQFMSYGRYYEGTYVGYSRKVLSNDSVSMGLAVASIDEYGKLSGLYVDETTSSTLYLDTYATKQSLEQFYALEQASDYTWKEQAERFAAYVVDKQTLNQLSLYSTSSMGQIFEETFESIYKNKVYTASVEDVTIRVDLIAEATQNALTNAKQKPVEETQTDE